MLIGNTLWCAPTFTSYQWSDANGPIPRATFQQYTPGISGSYWVTVIDSYGCESTSIRYFYLTVGIEEIKEDFSVMIYPSPANSAFTIQVPCDYWQMQISDSRGQVLQTKVVQGQNNMKFEIHDSGIYFIKVTTSNQTIIKKLIVYK